MPSIPLPKQRLLQREKHWIQPLPLVNVPDNQSGPVLGGNRVPGGQAPIS
jgi:hypothetical protein